VPRSGVAFINGDDANCLEVAEGSPAPIVTVGFSDHCKIRIENVEYDGEMSHFSLKNQNYSIPMSGEFNVRNAAMAVCSALFAEIPIASIREGLLSFSGIARRQQLRGQKNGVKVVDDFAHHPTAISLAIDALRQKYAPERLWVIFEPRSNTTRRSIFQNELASALANADRAIVAGVTDLDKIAVAERLSPELLITDVTASGTPARFFESVDEIVEHVKKEAVSGDVIAVLSNGGFEDIHDKILAAID
jgi:UDP-N-acetylmuramate: L-alanyl-gamma-D-glutamyl-meso-diaminopimelate ligase